MGGWNIWWALANFAVLAVLLYLFGRKIVVNMYSGRRQKIAGEMERAQAAEENAKVLEGNAARLDESGEEECRAILTWAEEQAEQELSEADSARLLALDGVRRSAEREESRLRTERRRELNRSAGELLSADAAAIISAPENAEARERLLSVFIDSLERGVKLEPGELRRINAAGKLTAVLTLAERPEPAELLHIHGALCRALDAQGAELDAGSVSIDTRVDGDIIAGGVLAVDYTVFDGSVKCLLERLKAGLAAEDEAEGDFIEELKTALTELDLTPELYQSGRVTSVSDGICRVSGLPDAMAGEMLDFGGGLIGMVMDLETDNIGVALLGEYDTLHEGDLVRRTGRIIEVPAGPELLGRVVDALGRPVDGGEAIHAKETRAIESPAPGVVQRQPVSVPMQTGIKAIDALVPIGRGQRELIVGDRQTGKTSIALDTILNQKGKDMLCIFVAIGQKESTVASVVEKLREHGAMGEKLMERNQFLCKQNI